VYFFASGDRYEGEFRNGNIYGTGTFFAPDGTTKSGFTGDFLRTDKPEP